MSAWASVVAGHLVAAMADVQETAQSVDIRPRVVNEVFVHVAGPR